MGKITSRTALIVVLLIAVSAVVGSAAGFGWWLFGGDNDASAQAELPPYIVSPIDPVFDPECGEDIRHVSGGGFGFNPDLKWHAEKAIAVVEGMARLAGPARFAVSVHASDGSRPTGGAFSISTPFIIEVSETHKGPEQSEWMVVEPGGVAECTAFRRSSTEIRLFDGAEGLFFISAEPAEWQDLWVSLTIAKDGPEWFNFTEEGFGSIENAVELISVPE